MGHRFVYKAPGNVKQRLSKETNELRSDISTLEKKLHNHEITFTNSRTHMQQIMGHGGSRG